MQFCVYANKNALWLYIRSSVFPCACSLQPYLTKPGGWFPKIEGLDITPRLVSFCWCELHSTYIPHHDDWRGWAPKISRLHIIIEENIFQWSCMFCNMLYNIQSILSNGSGDYFPTLAEEARIQRIPRLRPRFQNICWRELLPKFSSSREENLNDCQNFRWYRWSLGCVSGQRPGKSFRYFIFFPSTCPSLLQGLLVQAFFIPLYLPLSFASTLVD